MKKFLVISTTGSWTLAGLLTQTMHLGHAEGKNIEWQQKTTEISSYVQLSQSQKTRKRQHATNAKGTLYGENAGDSIILQWTLNESATEYFVYRSTSLNGPWEQVLRVSQAAARTGGAKEDLTPKARLMDLCYKVQAVDAAGLVIEFYEPICVPKFGP